MITGLSQIASDYDGVICDIWGVVHDGRKPNEAAVYALRSFRAGFGPVVLLTNAPRLADDVKRQFDRIGVPHDCYDAILTSGSGARADLERRIPAARPLALYHLGPDRDRGTYQGLNVALVAPADAEIVLCTGLFHDETESPADYKDLLVQLKARDLFLICANPDVTVRRGDDIVYCAGALAGAYEEIGGSVITYGKPHPAIFELALAELRRKGSVRHPLVIGDGPATDIKGANSMGWDALFVSGGLFGIELASLPADRVSDRVAELLAQHRVVAHATIRQLEW